MIIDTANLPQTVNNVFYFILAISVVLLVLITFLMVFFVIKYHRTRNKEPLGKKGNRESGNLLDNPLPHIRPSKTAQPR